MASYILHPLRDTPHNVIFLDTGNTDKQAVVIGSATAAGGVGLVAIIVLAVLFVKYRIARLLLNRSKVGDLYTTQDEHLSRRTAYIQEDDMIEKDESLWDDVFMYYKEDIHWSFPLFNSSLLSAVWIRVLKSTTFCNLSPL